MSAKSKTVGAIDKFNRIVKILATSLGKQFPEDATVARAQKRINLAIDVDPIFILKNVGSYLIKYHKEISANDEKFFLENDYDAELRAGIKEEKVTEVKIIMPKIKEAWKTLSDKDKDAYKKHVNDMLDLYLEYKLEGSDSPQPQKKQEGLTRTKRV
jgi:Zn-dependent M32 family carboxypeptidase